MTPKQYAKVLINEIGFLKVPTDAETDLLKEYHFNIVNRTHVLKPDDAGDEDPNAEYGMIFLKVTWTKKEDTLK